MHFGSLPAVRSSTETLGSIWKGRGDRVRICGACLALTVYITLFCPMAGHWGAWAGAAAKDKGQGGEEAVPKCEVMTAGAL